MLSLKMLNHKLRLKMGDYYEDKYQEFIDRLTKQADDYVARTYGVNPNREDKASEEEKPICTTDEFKDVCNELGLEKD